MKSGKKETAGLAVMAKAPVAGNVKTRLRGHLGDRDRLELYELLINCVIRSVSTARGVETYINYTPEEPRVREYFGRWGLETFPQSEGDIGLRMHSTLETLLGMGHGKALVVGVDLPGLNAGIIEEAVGLLDRVDLVFGPALDGGYYLAGLKEPRPELFGLDIPWSSAETLARTLEVSEGLGLSVGLTGKLRDLDTVEDLRAEGFF